MVEGGGGQRRGEGVIARGSEGEVRAQCEQGEKETDKGADNNRERTRTRKLYFTRIVV